MKIDYRDNNLIVFLNKKNVSSIDFFDKHCMEKYFRDLFYKFNNDYNMDLKGSYNIEVFIDDNFGIILDISSDDVDYFEYCSDVVDMNISISKYNKFMYKLFNGIGDLIKKCDVYIYNDDIYVIPNSLSYFEFGILLENSKIIYGEKCFKILKGAKKISEVLIIDKIV